MSQVENGGSLHQHSVLCQAETTERWVGLSTQMDHRSSHNHKFLQEIQNPELVPWGEFSLQTFKAQVNLLMQPDIQVDLMEQPC